MRKIIHIDMDCFFAAVEIRDAPHLRTKPVAVGGMPDERGVICTCNYIAREYGIRSAMATQLALKRCPDLIVLPSQFDKYRAESLRIRDIFLRYTSIIEPLSIDEAFLDVTDSPFHQQSATLIAQEIRQAIFKETQLTASAGVASNKLLAKIASGWRKPNGLFVITPEQIASFMRTLPIEYLWGVGQVTAQKFNQQGIHTCFDLQQLSLVELINYCGAFGARLYHLCRGEDDRLVESHDIRKSVSVEETFPVDLQSISALQRATFALYPRLQQRLNRYQGIPIHKLIVKIKFSNFQTTTIEKISKTTQLPEIDHFYELLDMARLRQSCAIRLLGLGVRFKLSDSTSYFVDSHQLDIFYDLHPHLINN